MLNGGCMDMSDENKKNGQNEQDNSAEIPDDAADVGKTLSDVVGDSETSSDGIDGAETPNYGENSDDLVVEDEPLKAAKNRVVKPSSQANDGEDSYMSTGICIGMAVGLSFGMLLSDDTAAGLSIGMSLGMCVGMLIGMCIKKKK